MAIGGAGVEKYPGSYWLYPDRLLTSRMKRRL